MPDAEDDGFVVVLGPMMSYVRDFAASKEFVATLLQDKRL